MSDYFNPMTCSPPALLSLGFSEQNTGWIPFPFPRGSWPRIEPVVSLALAGGFLPCTAWMTSSVTLPYLKSLLFKGKHLGEGFPEYGDSKNLPANTETGEIPGEENYWQIFLPGDMGIQKIGYMSTVALFLFRSLLIHIYILEAIFWAENQQLDYIDNSLWPNWHYRFSKSLLGRSASVYGVSWHPISTCVFWNGLGRITSFLTLWNFNKLLAINIVKQLNNKANLPKPRLQN